MNAADALAAEVDLLLLQDEVMGRALNLHDKSFRMADYYDELYAKSIAVARARAHAREEETL